VTTTTHYPGDLAEVTTNPAGTTTDSYDANGDLTSVAYNATASGYATPANLAYSYNLDGSRHTMTDATGTTTYSYDANGDVTSQALAAASGNGLANATTSYGYYTTGGLQTVTYPAYTGYSAPQVTYSYDGTGAMASETDWLGNQVTFSHDPDNNPTGQNNHVTTANPNGTSSTTWSYDNADQNTQASSTLAQTCGGNETLTQAFTGTGGSRNPDGQLTQYSASYSGSCSGQASYQRNYSYDPAGRLVYQGNSAQGASPNNFAYDPAGDPTTISEHDPAGNFNTYTQTFDNAGENTGQTPTGPTGLAATYSYDTLGDQTQTATTAGTTTNSYDQAGHMTATASPNGNATYLYNGDGLEAATTVTGQAWQTPSDIDSTNNIHAVSCPTTTFCVAVDNLGNALTYNGTTWTSTGIDSGRNLNSVSCTNSSFCMAGDATGHAVVYNGNTWTVLTPTDGANQINSLSCPTSTSCFGVDNAGNALAYSYTGGTWNLTVTNIDSTTILEAVSCPTTSFCMAVDHTGNAFNYNGTTWTAAVNIDSTRSINGVSCANPNFCIAADGTGHALSYNGSSWSTATIVDGTHNIDGISCPTTSFCIAVDRSGNTITYKNGTWAAATDTDANRIIDDGSCPTSTFCAAVDTTGYAELYGNATTTTTNQLAWSTPANSLAEVLSDGTTDYIYGPTGTPVEQINLATSTPTYLTYTPSNGSWLATNGTGDENGYWGYDAYGNLAFGAPASPLGYSGQFLDSTTGFVNDRARWYEPQSGAFSSRDPLFVQTDTAFTYAGADPVNSSDPTGDAQGLPPRGYYWQPIDLTPWHPSDWFYSSWTGLLIVQLNYGNSSMQWGFLMSPVVQAAFHGQPVESEWEVWVNNTPINYVVYHYESVNYVYHQSLWGFSYYGRPPLEYLRVGDQVKLEFVAYNTHGILGAQWEVFVDY
jgi:RHS repeat-associated protein